MNIEPINDANFLLFAARHYDAKLSVSTSEFQEDINRIKYIRKLITRYQQSGVLKERLILNHIIILSNVFRAEICCKILLFKLHDQAKYIKPFLIFLGLLPAKLYRVGSNDVLDTDLIEMDIGIINALRGI